MKELTEEQIAELKKQHGLVFRYTSEDGKSCLLKSPDLKTIDMCRVLSGGSAIQFDTAMVENCWIDGDPEFRTSDAHRMGLYEWLGGIIKRVDGQLEEL